MQFKIWNFQLWADYAVFMRTFETNRASKSSKKWSSLGREKQIVLCHAFALQGANLGTKNLTTGSNSDVLDWKLASQKWFFRSKNSAKSKRKDNSISKEIIWKWKKSFEQYSNRFLFLFYLFFKLEVKLEVQMRE